MNYLICNVNKQGSHWMVILMYLHINWLSSSCSCMSALCPPVNLLHSLETGGGTCLGVMQTSGGYLMLLQRDPLCWHPNNARRSCYHDRQSQILASVYEYRQLILVSHFPLAPKMGTVGSSPVQGRRQVCKSGRAWMLCKKL